LGARALRAHAHPRLESLSAAQKKETHLAQATQGQGFLGHVQQMLQTHPGKGSLDRAGLLECIQACFDCAQACIACADACLGEPGPKPRVRCIRLNQDCTDVCEATGKVLSRQTACLTACRLCAEECAQHAQKMEHCRVCADACRRCEEACRKLLALA
jgi:hypothetical protein